MNCSPFVRNYESVPNFKNLYQYAIKAKEIMTRQKEQADAKDMAERLLDEILHEAILDLNESGAHHIESNAERTKKISNDILISIIDQVPSESSTKVNLSIG